MQRSDPGAGGSVHVSNAVVRTNLCTPSPSRVDASVPAIEPHTRAWDELRARRAAVDSRLLTLAMLVHCRPGAGELAVPLLRDARMVALGAVGFGVALYVVNFQILGRTAFPWFQEGPDQVFELVAHAGFGLLLVPFFLSRRFTATRGRRAG
jgi:hypothetical protein